MAGSADGDVVGTFVRIDIDAIRALANRRVIAMTQLDLTLVDATARRSAPARLLRRLDSDDLPVRRTRDAFDAAVAEVIDDILIHEVWGHVVPVAERRHDSARCPDPEPDQDPLTSCVIQRENLIRAELGLMPTAQYGIVDCQIPPPPEPPLRDPATPDLIR
jgi:hypothetical protein